MPHDSQRDRILAHLLTGATLTPKQALDSIGCFRLGARIYALRKAGYQIEDVRKSYKVNYSVYRLVATPDACATASCEATGSADPAHLGAARPGPQAAPPLRAEGRPGSIGDLFAKHGAPA